MILNLKQHWGQTFINMFDYVPLFCLSASRSRVEKSTKMDRREKQSRDLEGWQGLRGSTGSRCRRGVGTVADSRDGKSVDGTSA